MTPLRKRLSFHSATPAACFVAMATLSVGACTLASRELGDHVVSCQDGECRCETGFGMCDDDPDNGCDTNLNTAPEHCGECGHGCQGGGCEDGRCQPLVVWETSGNALLELALGERYLFWTIEYADLGAEDELLAPGLWAMSLDGGDPVRLGEETTSWMSWTVAGDTVYSLAHDSSIGEQVVWASAVDAAPRRVGSWPGEASPGAGLVADDQHVYAGAVEGLIELDLATGNVSTLIAEDFSSESLALAPGLLLWMPGPAATELQILDLLTHQQRTWATGEPVLSYVQGLVANRSHAFWATHGGHLGQIELANGELTDLGTLPASECSLAANESHLFVGQYLLGTVIRILVGGGAREDVVERQPNPSFLALGPSSLYFVAGPRILRVAL